MRAGRGIIKKLITMNNANGWIKIHRKIREWQHYGEPSVLVVFIDLLLSAHTESGWVNGIKVKRGQVLTSISRLMENTGIRSDNTVRNALKKLVASGEIEKSSTNKYTLITINQFNKYQCYANNAERTAEQTAEQGADQTADRKEIKERKNNIPPPPTRVREEKPIEEYMNELQSEQLWIEQICMNNKIPPEDFNGRVQQFVTECKCNGKDTADSINDAKSHFQGWLRIQLNAERKEKNTNGNNNRRNEDPSERLNRLLNGDIRN